MKTTADYIVSGFAKIDSDLNYLMGCLKEVLLELGETKAAEFLPWQEGGQTHDINQPPPRIEQAYSIAFQLLNLVEENASAMGVSYEDNEELEFIDKIEKRDRERYELDENSKASDNSI